MELDCAFGEVAGRVYFVWWVLVCSIHTVGKARQKAFPEQTCSPILSLASSAWPP